MPLPAALAAKLAKRGILSKAPKSTPKLKISTPKPASVEESVEEEVFAEDYDEEAGALAEQQEEPMVEDPPGDSESNTARLDGEPSEDEGFEEERLVHEASACPNQTNKYHDCLEFCRKRWGYRDFEPSEELEPKRQRLLRRYPLPEGWDEVGDPVTGRYYYWNTDTDEVSWLPPQHPRAVVSLPDERLKELEKPAKEASASSSESEEEEEDIMDIDDFEKIEKKILEEKRRKERERDRSSVVEKKHPKRKEALDPMDPAAYSDIPRGTWSTGLDRRGSAKTGVDATATGPLYQQRPYPSPGDILRMNNTITPVEEEDED